MHFRQNISKFVAVVVVELHAAYSLTRLEGYNPISAMDFFSKFRFVLVNFDLFWIQLYALFFDPAGISCSSFRSYDEFPYILLVC